MNIIFAGTPEFAVPSLQQLVQSRHQVIAVYTQPDRPAGRGQRLTESPIKICAKEHNLPMFQPTSLRAETAQSTLKALNADLMVVVAYGLLLPQAILDAPRLGCINVHPSLLPRWRGAAPIQRAVLAGDKHTGVAIMQLDAGMDTGPILMMEATPIAPFETSGALHDRLAAKGATLLLKTIDALEAGTVTPIPQASEGSTHAAKITKSEAQLNWHASAITLQHRVCGYYPWPVAYTTYQGHTLRILEAHALENATNATPGTVIAASMTGIDVATTQGVLRLLTIQLANHKPMSVADFLNGRTIELGYVLGENSHA